MVKSNFYGVRFYRIFVICFVGQGLALALANAEIKKSFEIYKIDGKPSPIYTILMHEDSVFEIDLTQLADNPLGPDFSKYTGVTKGKLIRVYKGKGDPGKEIDFVGGLGTWRVGDRMIIFFGKDRRPKLTLIKGNSGKYDDFVSAFGPFAGKISEDNDALKKVVIEMRRKIRKECETAKSKQEAAKCKYREMEW